MVLSITIVRNSFLKFQFVSNSTSFVCANYFIVFDECWAVKLKTEYSLVICESFKALFHAVVFYDFIWCHKQHARPIKIDSAIIVGSNRKYSGSFLENPMWWVILAIESDHWRLGFASLSLELKETYLGLLFQDFFS